MQSQSRRTQPKVPNDLLNPLHMPQLQLSEYCTQLAKELESREKQLSHQLDTFQQDIFLFNDKLNKYDNLKESFAKLAGKYTIKKQQLDDINNQYTTKQAEVLQLQQLTQQLNEQLMSQKQNIQQEHLKATFQCQQNEFLAEQLKQKEEQLKIQVQLNQQKEKDIDLQQQNLNKQQHEIKIFQMQFNQQQEEINLKGQMVKKKESQIQRQTEEITLKEENLKLIKEKTDNIYQMSQQKMQQNILLEEQLQQLKDQLSSKEKILTRNMSQSDEIQNYVQQIKQLENKIYKYEEQLGKQQITVTQNQHLQKEQIDYFQLYSQEKMLFEDMYSYNMRIYYISQVKQKQLEQQFKFKEQELDLLIEEIKKEVELQKIIRDVGVQCDLSENQNMQTNKVQNQQNEDKPTYYQSLCYQRKDQSTTKSKTFGYDDLQVHYQNEMESEQEIFQQPQSLSQSVQLQDSQPKNEFIDYKLLQTNPSQMTLSRFANVQPKQQ